MSDVHTAEELLPDLHREAGNGDLAKVKFLLTSASSSSCINMQAGSKKNTPLHISVIFRNKGITRHLIASGACVTQLNADGAMPITYCNERDMVEAILSCFLNYRKNYPQNNNNMADIWGVDYKGRNILHYAASIHGSNSADLIFDLISTSNSSDNLTRTDYEGSTFLDIAAREGNTAVLEALKKNMDSNINTINAETRERLINEHQVGLTALMHNHRGFFDELLGLGKVNLTLHNILQKLEEVVLESVLKEAENSNSNVTSNSGSAQVYRMIEQLKKIGESLPTYVALYAEKDEVFRFLIEKEVVTENQWDDKWKRTCLHWAVVHKRADIVQKLIKFEVLRPSPSIEDVHGNTALGIAFEKKNHEVMEIMRGRASFKVYEEKLLKDRDVHVQALNAILVVAALIASVVFSGWLQNPSGTSKKMVWALSFYAAVISMYISIVGLVPTRTKYVYSKVKLLQLALYLALAFQAVSLFVATYIFSRINFETSPEDLRISRNLAFVIILFLFYAPMYVGGPKNFLLWLVGLPKSLLSLVNDNGESSRSRYPHAVVWEQLSRDLVGSYVPPLDTQTSHMKIYLQSLGIQQS